MELANVILKPILTEKALTLREQGVWSFYTDPRASKGMIKRAVEMFFGVSAQKIRVINVKPKTKQLQKKRKTITLTKSRKALIWLKEGEKIKGV